MDLETPAFNRVRDRATALKTSAFIRDPAFIWDQHLIQVLQYRQYYYYYKYDITTMTITATTVNNNNNNNNNNSRQ